MTILETPAEQQALPGMDGHYAQRIGLSFGGSLELDPMNEDDLALIDGLKLGQEVTLRIAATVAGKGFGYVASDLGDKVAYRVTVRVHSLDA